MELVDRRQDWRDVDQRVTSAVLEVMPKLAVTARLTRRLQYEAVHELVSEYGVRQFLDLGTGLPTAGAVHEIAQRAAPESRVVYVDNDPQAGIHARALLVSSPQGAASFLEADLREPGKILAHATGILDFSQAVAIFCLMVLHFLADADDPWGIVRRLAEGGGDRYLVLAHARTDFDDEAAQAAERAYNERSPVAIHTRSRHEVQRFFTDAGFDLLAPGLVMPAQRWPAEASDLLDVPGYFGMGWRPAARHPREASSRAGSQDATRQ